MQCRPLKPPCPQRLTPQHPPRFSGPFGQKLPRWQKLEFRRLSLTSLESESQSTLIHIAVTNGSTLELQHAGQNFVLPTASSFRISVDFGSSASAPEERRRAASSGVEFPASCIDTLGPSGAQQSSSDTVRMTRPAVDYSLYYVTGRALLPSSSDPDYYLQHLELALKGGVTVVQIREKDVDGGEFFQVARRSKQVCDRVSSASLSSTPGPAQFRGTE